MNIVHVNQYNCDAHPYTHETYSLSNRVISIHHMYQHMKPFTTPQEDSSSVSVPKGLFSIYYKEKQTKNVTNKPPLPSHKRLLVPPQRPDLKAFVRSHPAATQQRPLFRGDPVSFASSSAFIPLVLPPSPDPVVIPTAIEKTIDVSGLIDFGCILKKQEEWRTIHLERYQQQITTHITIRKYVYDVSGSLFSLRIPENISLTDTHRIVFECSALPHLRTCVNLMCPVVLPSGKDYTIEFSIQDFIFYKTTYNALQQRKDRASINLEELYVSYVYSTPSCWAYQTENEKGSFDLSSSQLPLSILYVSGDVITADKKLVKPLSTIVLTKEDKIKQRPISLFSGVFPSEYKSYYIRNDQQYTFFIDDTTCVIRNTNLPLPKDNELVYRSYITLKFPDRSRFSIYDDVETYMNKWFTK